VWASAVLKLFLQLLVCLSLSLRLMALVAHLRRAWRGSAPPASEGQALAQAFRRELHRRGQLPGLPLARPD
jgi:hypothetical protein